MLFPANQWFRAFNTGNWSGEVRHIKTVAEADLQKWDIIHVNLCGVTAPIIPKIKEAIKNSSTILIINQDYATENFETGFQKPRDFYEAIKAADFIFCQEPVSVSFMNFMLKHHFNIPKKAVLVPHPCDMTLKKYRVDFEKRLDMLAVIYHRYKGELLIPSMLSWGLKYPTTLFGLVAGNIPVGLFNFTSPYMDWSKYFYVLAHCSIGLDYISGYHCMGRFQMETSCLSIPTVCTNNIYMGVKLFPQVTHDPTDFEGIRGSLQKLIEDEEFYHLVAEYAYEQVENYNWENSRKRLLTALQEAGFRIG